MTANEKLALIHTKTRRARKHIRDLELEIRSFLESDPAPYVYARQPVRYYAVGVTEPPIEIALIAGDVLFNLRAALDHLAYQLALNRTSDEKILKVTAFPIYKDAETYEGNKQQRLSGLSVAAKTAIDEYRPYKGGNDTLWRLSELNNRDKHRILVTVGSMVSFHSISATREGPILDSINAKLPAETQVAEIMPRPANRACPLKEGDELFLAWSPVLESDEVTFKFDIAIHEPQIIECELLVPTLIGMADHVEKLITSFKSLLGE
jgi:hypothetical protein